MQFHTNCFTCSICAISITGPKGFINDPEDSLKQYCPDCYVEKFAERCSLSDCKRPIAPGTEYLMVDQSDDGKDPLKFHKDCFRCTACDQSLADATFIQDADGNFCETCAAA